MSHVLQKADVFNSDVARQFDWYCDEANENIAWKFHGALENTLQGLAQYPEIGVRRRFRHARLHGLRSLPVEPPFNRLLIFYRIDGSRFEVIRLMHGARDLGRRLLEFPEAD